MSLLNNEQAIAWFTQRLKQDNLEYGERPCVHAALAALRAQQDVTDRNVGDKWISVKDRLPSQIARYGKYLTYWKNGSVDITTFAVDENEPLYKHEFFSSYTDYTGDIVIVHNLQNKNLTHWMPLPEPPKEETP